MAILNPVVSKFTLTAGVPQEVYVCPPDKTHAIVDVNFFKDDLNSDAVIAIAMSSDSNPANLTSVDYFIDDIQLISTVNVAELNKIIVGQNERLYIKVMSGPDIIVRVSGVEENNPKVIKAGRLAASSIAGTSQTQVFVNTYSSVSYISASVTIFNTSATNNATVEAWITSAGTPAISDKILKIEIPTQDTTILENVLLSPNERIFVKSSEPNTEYFINGTVVSSV